MCRCKAEKQEVENEFRISDDSDLVELLVIKENIGSVRNFRLSNGHIYKIGHRYDYVYAYEGDVQELLNITLRNKRILQL